MQADIDKIVYRLTRKKTLTDISVQDLEDLVKDYPYFPVTHFLLARKSLAADHSKAKERVREAALYIPDPAWLHYALNEDLEIIPEEEHIEIPELPTSDTAVTQTTEAFAPLPEITMPKVAAAAENISETVTEFTGTTDKSSETSPLQSANDFVSRHLSETLQQIKVEAEKAEDITAVPIDPYHSIDYFASQGIKLQAEDLNKDQMGRKLKKFTEWLKTMKKIPANESAADIDDATNQNIQNLAAHSLANPQIVTEAMAEVLEKQKRYDKAIEVYKKLSLQNPGKSPYFASRIDELNQLLS